MTFGMMFMGRNSDETRLPMKKTLSEKFKR